MHTRFPHVTRYPGFILLWFGPVIWIKSVAKVFESVVTSNSITHLITKYYNLLAVTYENVNDYKGGFHCLKYETPMFREFRIQNKTHA